MAKENMVYIPTENVIVKKDFNARSGDWTKVEDPETGQDWEAFKASIAKDGIQTPIEVRPAGKNFEIIAGHRRHLAASQLKLATVPCIVRELSDYAARLRNIQENTDRENLKGADLAWALADASKLATDGKQTQQEIATSIGRNQSYVGKLLKIMGSVQPKLTKAWREATAPITVAEMYSLCDVPKEKQEEEFQRMIQRKTEGGSARGPGAWVETAGKKAFALGEAFGKAKRLGFIEGVDGDWLDIVGELVKMKADAKLGQRKKVATQMKKGFEQGLTEPEESEDSEEDDDAA